MICQKQSTVSRANEGTVIGIIFVCDFRAVLKLRTLKTLCVVYLKPERGLNQEGRLCIFYNYSYVNGCLFQSLSMSTPSRIRTLVDSHKWFANTAVEDSFEVIAGLMPKS